MHLFNLSFTKTKLLYKAFDILSLIEETILVKAFFIVDLLNSCDSKCLITYFISFTGLY